MCVRELRVIYVDRSFAPGEASADRLSCPREVAQVLVRLLAHEPVEVFGVLCLTTKHDVIGYHEVSRGTLDATIVHPREVFKAAVMENASAVIVAHNHPSGDPTPSPEDAQLTTRLKEAGRLLGIDVLDHIVIGHDDRYFSFREVGRL